MVLVAFISSVLFMNIIIMVLVLFFVINDFN
jgi:hypothetical protein